MTTKPIRIGIIGSGGIAGAHVDAYKTLENVEVVAVADLIPGKAREFIDKKQLDAAEPFEDFRHMLELELDGVSICTPNAAHYETTIAALQAGKHVLVEKPMSVTLEEAVDMVAAAKRSDRMLSVGFQPRYDPNMQLIQDIVRSGKLGKVYYVETGGGRRRGIPGGTFVRKSLAGAGAMADIGCYSLDMALNALGYPRPLTVSAFTSNYFGTNAKYFAEADRFDVEDFGVAIVRLEGGTVLNFKISWAMHMDTLGATMFLGDEAGLKVTPAGTGPWSGVWDGRVGSASLYFDDQDGQHVSEEVQLIDHQLNVFHEKIRHFAQAVAQGGPAPIPGEQILYNQAIVDGVQRSAELGREVDIVLPNFN